jgi:hypothetical protein
MEALRLILRYAHLIGFALLFGGAIAQFLTGKFRISSAMLWGASIQLATGILLAAPLQRPEPLSNAKLAVKGVFALLIFIAVFVPRKREAVAKGHFFAIVGMTLVNAAVAVFWR